MLQDYKVSIQNITIRLIGSGHRVYIHITIRITTKTEKLGKCPFRILADIPVFLIGILGGGVHLGPLGTAATNRPIVPAPGDYDDGEIGGMIGRGNRSTRRKPASVPLCPPQRPHAARTRTPAATVGSQQLTVLYFPRNKPKLGRSVLFQSS
jgi:hypothetical protein